MAENQEICVDCAPTSSIVPAVAPTLTKSEDPLDRSTFIPPTAPKNPTLVIEYCDRCRWLHRATWVATEITITFPSPMIRTVSLIASVAPEPAGRFRIWLLEDGKANADDVESTLIWDRKVDGGFPELKDLKQRLRDRVAPGMSLGHSDKK